MADLTANGNKTKVYEFTSSVHILNRIFKRLYVSLETGEK